MVQRHRPDGEAVVDGLTVSPSGPRRLTSRGGGGFFGAPAAAISRKGLARHAQTRRVREHRPLRRAARARLDRALACGAGVSVARARRPRPPRRRRQGVADRPRGHPGPQRRRAQVVRRPDQHQSGPQRRRPRRRPRRSSPSTARRSRSPTPASMIELSPGNPTLLMKWDDADLRQGRLQVRRSRSSTPRASRSRSTTRGPARPSDTYSWEFKSEGEASGGSLINFDVMKKWFWYIAAGEHRHCRADGHLDRASPASSLSSARSAGSPRR